MFTIGRIKRTLNDVLREIAWEKECASKKNHRDFINKKCKKRGKRR